MIGKLIEITSGKYTKTISPYSEPSFITNQRVGIFQFPFRCLVLDIIKTKRRVPLALPENKEEEYYKVLYKNQICYIGKWWDDIVIKIL